ncbi:hypothetical protein ACRRTK_015312 [Alexandromys fortis]
MLQSLPVKKLAIEFKVGFKCCTVWRVLKSSQSDSRLYPEDGCHGRFGLSFSETFVFISH